MTTKKSGGFLSMRSHLHDHIDGVTRATRLRRRCPAMRTTRIQPTCSTRARGPNPQPQPEEAGGWLFPPPLPPPVVPSPAVEVPVVLQRSPTVDLLTPPPTMRVSRPSFLFRGYWNVGVNVLTAWVEKDTCPPETPMD